MLVLLIMFIQINNEVDQLIHTLNNYHIYPEYNRSP